MTVSGERFLSRLRGWFLWDRQTTISTEPEFQEYVRRVGLRWNLVPGRLHRLPLGAYAFAAIACTALYLIGLALAWRGGQTVAFLRDPLSLLYPFEIFAFLAIAFWLERHGRRALVSIRPVFEVDDAAYFDFIGGLVERIYEPVPTAVRPSGRRFHRPTLVGSIALFALSYVVIGWLPSGFSTSLLIRGPPTLQAYFLGVHLIAIVITTWVLWMAAVSWYLMGVRAAELPVRLDITRTDDHLGLKPYGRVVLRTIVAYAVVVMATGALIIDEPSPVFIVPFIIHTIVVPVSFVGSQYGFHRGIVRAKRDRLQELREEYADELDRWFSEAGTVADRESISELDSLIRVKREIEAIPDWPTKTTDFGKMATVTLLSNVPVMFQFVTG